MTQRLAKLRIHQAFTLGPAAVVVLALTVYGCTAGQNLGDRAADAGPPDASAPETSSQTSEGGADSGGNVDSGVACKEPTDCGKQYPPGVPFCALNSGFSCVNGACVYECGSQVGRLCTTSNASGGGPLCLECTWPFSQSSKNCSAGSCSSVPTTMRVEESTCTSFPLDDDMITLTPIGTTCGFDASRLDGADQLGTITVLDGEALAANVPTQGGTCTGLVLASRGQWVFSCPGCQFVLAN